MRKTKPLLGLLARAGVSIAIGIMVGAVSPAARSKAHGLPQIAVPRQTVSPNRSSTISAPSIGRPLAWMVASDGIMLTEKRQDWRIVCVRAPAGKRCALSHMTFSTDGQRELTIELFAPRDRLVRGVIVLPLGLDLDVGVFVEVAGTSTMQAERFRTCVPGGCILQVSFDPTMTSALRTHSTLNVHAIKDNGDQIIFPVSLAGFGAALDRVGSLLR